MPNCDLSPPYSSLCPGRAGKVLQAGVSWGGVIKELAPTAPILSHIIQGMALDAALLQPCMRVSLAQKAILILHPPVALLFLWPISSLAYQKAFLTSKSELQAPSPSALCSFLLKNLSLSTVTAGELISLPTPLFPKDPESQKVAKASLFPFCSFSLASV